MNTGRAKKVRHMCNYDMKQERVEGRRYEGKHAGRKKDRIAVVCVGDHGRYRTFKRGLRNRNV